MVSLRWNAAAVLLLLSSLVTAHGHDEAPTESKNATGIVGEAMFGSQEVDYYHVPSYSGLSEHTGLMVAHVGLMVLAWIFVLPIGVMFSISRSRYTIPVQFLFLVVNGIGVLLATVYNVKTPDMYENNAHHKLGWVATWVMVAQTVMSLLFLYSGRSKQETLSTSAEHAAFLPVSVENMAHHDGSPYRDYRWLPDNRSATGRSSTTLNSPRDISPTDPERIPKPESPGGQVDDEEYEDLSMPMPAAPRRLRFRVKVIDALLAKHAPSWLSGRLLRGAEIGYATVDRMILIMGFSALMSGLVTYAGLMHGTNIFNGMTHFVKGGIFFWYGLLTLGRWMGCWASWGWSWNAEPSRSQTGESRSRVPSAEFVESFVIFLYGTTNVFMEHMAAWGSEWTAQDLEHVSITIMFFGGGLLGMLVESKTIRRWLNTSIESLPLPVDSHPSDDVISRQPPRTYSSSLNPVPALVILLLGIMMSSHHQSSMVSTMVHKQWGTLLGGFSLARIVTYIIMYISPPTSIYPSRPPSELIASFCLISGGLIFMASTRDVIRVMEDRDLMAMFVFTVVMGLTSFLMAWEVIIISLKGWATRREQKTTAHY